MTYDEIEVLVLRVKNVIKNVKKFCRVHKTSGTIIKRGGRGETNVFESQYYKYALLVSDDIIFDNEFVAADDAEKGIGMIYTKDSEITYYNNDGDNVKIGDYDGISLSLLHSEEYIFQQSISLHPSEFDALYFTLLCDKHQLPEFSITSTTLDQLEHLLTGTYYDYFYNYTKGTPEGNFLNPTRHP